MAPYSELRPIRRDAARAFVVEHHRHSEPPVSWLFGVGLYIDDELRAVGMAGRPIARALDDGRTVEITRICTLGDRNAASRVYGSLCRPAKALGYRRAVTYTLAEEVGSSVLAAGFRRDGTVRGRPHIHSDGPRALDLLRLWEPPKMPTGPKVRWIRDPL